MHANDMGLGFKTQVQYVVHHAGTCILEPDGFLLGGFFLDFFLGGWSWRTGPLPPLEWTLLMPLVTAVFITLKGAEPSDSHHTGVIGALVYFLAPKTIY